MEACSNVSERELDLLLTSPGGSPEAAESVVHYLRTRFDHIRVIVPVAAMSAGTMIALAADEIVMGSHSQLGPIDPQFTISSPEGPRSAPAQAILDQFELAKQQCQDPKNIAAWLPILRGLMPGLIAQCQASQDLSRQYAERWLKAQMFKGDPDAAAKAAAAAAWFSDFKYFKSHTRRVSRDDARDLSLSVTDLEDDPMLQDAALSVYHANRLTLSTTPAIKIIENHLGRAAIDQIQSIVVQAPTPAPTPALTGPPPPANPFEKPSRAERRRQERGDRNAK